MAGSVEGGDIVSCVGDDNDTDGASGGNMVPVFGGGEPMSRPRSEVEAVDTGRVVVDAADSGIALLAADNGGRAAEESEGDTMAAAVEIAAGRLSPVLDTDGVRTPEREGRGVRPVATEGRFTVLADVALGGRTGVAAALRSDARDGARAGVPVPVPVPDAVRTGAGVDETGREAGVDARDAPPDGSRDEVAEGVFGAVRG